MYCQLLAWLAPIINYNCYRPAVQCLRGSLAARHLDLPAALMSLCSPAAVPRQVLGKAEVRLMHAFGVAATKNTPFMEEEISSILLTTLMELKLQLPVTKQPYDLRTVYTYSRLSVSFGIHYVKHTLPASIT